MQCPNCGGTEIVRCKTCSSERYRCKCGLTGPKRIFNR